MATNRTPSVEIDTLNPPQQTKEEIILQAILPLQKLCEKNNLAMLGYLLGMAAAEAEDVMRKQARQRRKKGP